MPRKKQKRAPDHFNRGEAGPKPGPPSTLSKSKGHKQVSAKEVGSKKLPVQQNQRPIVPFLRKDRILLIGEGESSYFIAPPELLFSMEYMHSDHYTSGWNGLRNVGPVQIVVIIAR